MNRGNNISSYAQLRPKENLNNADLSDVKLWHFTLQELYEAAEFYADSTTDQTDNAEVLATIRAFLSWFEDGWNHQPTEEELAAHYKSIAEPYGGAL